MDLSISQQAWVFLWSLLLGAGLGLLYDFFRILRLAIRWNSFWIFIQDLLYWFICAVATFFYIFATNSGEVRWYIFFGALCGAGIYFVTLSVLLMRSSRAVIRFFKMLLHGLWDLITLPFRFFGMVCRPKHTLRGRKLKNTRKISKKYFQIARKRDRMKRNKGSGQTLERSEEL